MFEKNSFETYPIYRQIFESFERRQTFTLKKVIIRWVLDKDICVRERC